jgi:uncharacterized membrane protein
MNKFFKFLIIIIIILGVFFRFANLDKKVYSADEVRKIYRTVGYTKDEFQKEVFTGNIITVKEIQDYQKLHPKKSWADTLNALSGNPEHPPLYFIVTRLLMQIVNQPITARLTSVLASLLLFPVVFLLCKELFQSRLFGWINIILLSVSPLQINAAQNASQYSFWLLITALSSAIFLRTLRINNLQNWVLYTLTVIAGLYTHLYFITVIFTHVIYIIMRKKLKLNKQLIKYLLPYILSFLGFVPWLLIIFTKTTKLEQNIGYYNQFTPSFREIINRVLNNIANNFVDFHNTTRIENYLGYLILLIIVCSLYLLINKESKQTWVFILLLIFITPLVHILPNFISPSARPLQTRYYLPCYLGINLAVSYMIGYFLTVIKLPQWQKLFGKITFGLVISLGIISGIFITKIYDWGLDDQKGTANGQNTEIATIINQSKEPLIISEATHSFVLGLSYLVNDNSKFILVEDKNINQWQEKLNFSQLNQQFKNIFIYFPDQEFLNFIEKEQQIKLVQKAKGLELIVK